LKRSINKHVRFFAVFGLATSLLVVQGAFALAEDTLRGVGFGDSLMAGYQLPQGAGFPEQLEAALREQGHDVVISNAGVSGDTSSGGLARLDWSVPDGTDFVILELGGNDALRGIAPSITRDNLDAMITRLGARDIDVILAGILAPPNMGEDYRTAFDAIYPDLAAKHGVPFYRFFLDGALTHAERMLPDGIHPNEAGVAAMVERFLPLMTDYLASRSVQ